MDLFSEWGRVGGFILGVKNKSRNACAYFRGGGAYIQGSYFGGFTVSSLHKS